MELLICEELVLLGLDDEKGGTTWLENWPALQTAVLVDAIAAGAVVVSDDRLRAGDEPEHPLLRRLHAAVAQERPRPVTDWVTRVSSALKPLLGSVAQGLVARGVLEERTGKVLGLFSSVRYPQRDPAPERDLRARLRRVLVDGAAPSAHDTLLVALLHGDPGGLDRVLGDEPRDVRRAARARAAGIAEHAADQPAVRAAGDVAALSAALVVTTVIVPAAVLNGGSSSG